MTGRRAALLMVPLLFLGACSGSDEEDHGDAAEKDPKSSVDFDDCDFDVPAGVDMQCGTLEVPADREDPDGGEIELAFGIVRSDAPDLAADPVVYLSGGPGQSTLELVPQGFAQLYEPLTANRDLVLLDQRGTGLSEPSLACDEYTEWALGSLGSGLSDEELEAGAFDALDECHERLADDGVDFADYNSAASAADLEDLRVALDYDEWNLYGISYGTRLAQQAMRDHPDGIRSVVLDSAYPADADLYEEMPGNAERAMDALFATCADDPACATAYPDLSRTFQDLVAKLNAAPAPITVVDASSGERVDDELDGDALVGFLFDSLYSTELVPHLPEVITAASAGEFGSIGLLLGTQTQSLDFQAIGQQLAVQCHEEVSFGSREDVAAAAADHPLVEGYFESGPSSGSGIFDVCDSWDAGEAGSEANEKVSSDIPTLVLAGDLDPITPPRWGEQVAEDLSEAFYVQFPFTGHGALPSHECAVGIAEDFLDEPGQEPATGCVDDIAAPAFTPEGIQVGMTPFESDELELAGLRPEGWVEAIPGMWQESFLSSLIQQVVPGVTADEVLTTVAEQLGTEEPLVPVGELTTEAATWQLYRIVELGQSVDMALADGPDGLMLVQLTTSPSRADVHREQIFLPAVEAIEPLS
ncbi:alpha/beta hydrolase fold [Blastococcus aurantiacus]|uniref:Alpha/beta hydrolase fold n=1 Tax=Blastococcus aurantiacus TaxID=1550231 RepID=A0A1G7LH82_9ACTN|nr:alpha/beta hydrolase [Blastococcus aurantiacus]SDF48736.1 alpha/beta hydrolase fold [Blastococcus aurantiacus]